MTDLPMWMLVGRCLSVFLYVVAWEEAIRRIIKDDNSFAAAWIFVHGLLFAAGILTFLVVSWVGV